MPEYVDKLDPETQVCREHGVHWCVVCTCDDFEVGIARRSHERRERKRAWRETSVHEKFDLGGEA